LCNDDRVAVSEQIGQHLARCVIVDDGADWEDDDRVFSCPSGAVGAAARPSVFRFIVFLIAKVEEGRQPVGRCQDDTAAVSTVSSVGPPAGDEHLPSETADAVSSFAGLNGDERFIDEHKFPCLANSDHGVGKDDKEYTRLAHVGERENPCQHSRSM
jgi:hypothetical protein